MRKAGGARIAGIADMEGIPTPMPVGLLNRVQSLELKLEEVSQKCCRLEKENSSLRTWVQELQQGLKTAQKSFAAVEDLQQEVAFMANSTAEPSSPKSSDSTGSRRGVMFRNRESIVEIDGRLANGNSFGEEEPAQRKTKNRKPTGFVAQPMKAGVGFEDYDYDVEEVEVDKTPKRKVHGRTPTAFVPKKAASPDVDFDDDAEDILVEEEMTGPKRAVHGRKATAFIPKKAAAPNVEFEADAQDVEEVEVDNTPQRKVKGRQATAFVPKAPSHGASVDFRDDAEELEADDDGGGPKRAVHGRKVTAFVKAKAVGVEFEDEEEDVEEVEVDQTPKRSVHGRQATASVPKSKVRASPQVGFNDGAETLETEEDPEASGPKRSAHGRKATAFVPKARAAPGVSFNDDADQVEVEHEGEVPTRSAHGRKPTTFAPKGVGFEVEDEPEAKSPVPKLPLGDAGSDGFSSPSKRGVRFRGNDSVNELQEHGEVHAHAVRKRVPTKFVQEVKVQEEEEDEHAQVSFADAVSESDEGEDSVASTTPKLRPSRARVPTAFEKAYVPVEDDGSLTREELLELNKQPDQRPARPRLPTAFTQTGVAEAVRDQGRLSPRMEDMMKSMPEHMKEIVDNREDVDLKKHQLQGAAKDAAFAEGILRKLLYFKDVDRETIQKLIDAMEVFKFPDGTQVTRQGSARGTHFFIVSKGTMVILRNGEVKSEISQGAAFGENVILMSGGQDTTVQARGDVEVYGLSGLQTRALLAEQYQRERGQTSSAVNEALSSESCWLLRKLTPYQMQCLFDKVNVQTHEDGAEILSAGPKEHQDLHIVLQGQVSLVDPRGGEEIALVERMGVMGYTGVLYKEETFKAIARGSVQTLVLSSTLLQEMFGNALEETIIRSRILTSIRQQEELQHLRMDQLDGLASLYESIILKPGEVHERPAFRLGFILQGQAEATLINKEGLVIREPVILKDRGKVLIPEDADIEDKSPMLRLTLAAGETKNAQVAVWSGRTVAVFLEVVRKKKRLSASPDISPMSCSSEARQRSPSMRLAMVSDDKVGALRKVVVFRTLAQEQLENLADALEVESRKPGEIIFNQGEPGKEFYIIHTGLLEVSIGGRKVRTLGMGDYVGERALLLDENRSATVKVVEDCELWKMGADHFNKAVTIDSPIRDYMKARIDLQNTKVGLDSLQCMRVIGRGGFGVVKMVKSTTTNTRYALKCVSKKQAVEQKQQKALAHERNILAELDHPFIIKFVRSFNSARYVYFLTELVTGGELLDALDTLGLLQAPQAQFYSASIILAIEFLHERRIAYLDLKGENCLIDQHGYLKIIDFGVAERITSGKIFAVKGTPLFMAPEVILGKGYNTAADLWSLGVCLFDFMVGSFPFGDDQASNAEIFKAVLKAPLKFPKWLGVHEKEAKELMKALLHRDPAKRLGAGQMGYDELKEHPFYSDFRWEHLLARQLAPPFTPKGETYAEDAEGGKDAGLGSLTVTEEDRQGDDDWIDPDPSWADEF